MDKLKEIRQIFNLLANEGYGTNRVAQYLNSRGIKNQTRDYTLAWNVGACGY